MGAHIWLQDALNSSLDKGAWSKEVRAGSVVLPRVKTIVKVNKRLSWLLVYPNKEREELLAQGFPLPFQGHRKVSSASNFCISLKGRMTKCGLGKYMVLFLKGCSTEMAVDGGHQEGEAQAGWDECSKFCRLSIFLRVLKKGVMTRKILMLQLGELQL